MQQGDSSSRQEIGAPQDQALPATLCLPRLIVGAHLVLRDCAVEWIALLIDRAACEHLSLLLTLGERRAENVECHLDPADLAAACQGIVLTALPPSNLSAADLAQAPPDPVDCDPSPCTALSRSCLSWGGSAR